MIKNTSKFILVALIIVVLGTLALYGTRYLRYRQSPEYQAMQDIKNLERQYAEDPYGGSTPEETLQLFIDALKRGDIELASKYFVLEKQQQQLEDLAKIQERGLLNEMVSDLENSKRGKDLNINTVRFTITNGNKEVITIIQITKNINGKWKLLDF